MPKNIRTRRSIFSAHRAESSGLSSRIAFAAVMSLLGGFGRAVDVTTYHYDSFRTGYNNGETKLTPATVGSSAFTLIATAAFSGHVDAQPLIVSAATWAKSGFKKQFPHDVIYIATANNDLYSIDGTTGQVLASNNFGAPVPMPTCGDNAKQIGITSTPVIDFATGSMYLMTYTLESGVPVYRIHSVWLIDLQDNMPSTVVSATVTLSDGSQFPFQAAYQRQRPALLVANGNVYAGFGSFCDQNSQQSRGWLLGWDALTLSPLPSNAVPDTETLAQVGTGLTVDKKPVYFLSSIWMSGYGPSADSAGNIYVQTGNSNGQLTSNYPDSVLKLNSSLDVLDFFTPANFVRLDENDLDRGSGGVMVVPDQPGGLQFAVADGKDGRLFLLNRQALGEYVPGGPDVPHNVGAGTCWCGPAYYIGSDNQARVVSTGGTQVGTWFLPNSAAGKLTAEASGVALPSLDHQSGGFMASVSSNGQTPNSGVIWAVSRSSGGMVYLQALNATAGAGGGAVTDAWGAVWSLGKAARNFGEHVVLINGQPSSGIGVKLVIANDGRAYHLDGYGHWYTGDGTTWTAVATPPGMRPTSPVGTTVLASGNGVVTDAGGNVWSFGPAVRNAGEHEILRNGLPTTGWAVKLAIATDGTTWHSDSLGHWYTGNGTTWTLQAKGPLFVAPSPTGATITGPGRSLTDRAGNVWSLGMQQRNPGEHEVLFNGRPSGSGWAVSMVMAFGGTVWQHAYDGQWYRNTVEGGSANFVHQTVAPPVTNAAVGSAAWPAATGELSELQLVSAGAWPIKTSTANVVPVVANGHVYVATDNQLQIWGLQ